MRWLNLHGLRDEEGATAITVAISLVALFGLAAFAVDTGQLYQERRELQNGADGAVLAAAQDCADPATAASCVPVATPAVAGDCWTMTAALETRIDQYANANANDGESSACVVDLGASHVTVETETLSGGNGFLTHWFAGVIGHPTTTVTARATAGWGVFGGGATLPLTFSICEWQDLADPDGDGVYDLPTGRETIYFHSSTANDNPCIFGPANLDSPGGFGWLYPDGSECEAVVQADATVEGDVGNDIPSECSDPAYLESLLGQTVLVPVFGTVVGSGSNTVYGIVGFSGFVLDGYRLSGNPAYNRPSPPGTPPCKGDDRCISGVFTSFVAYGDEIAPPGGPDLGATVVVLTE